MMVRLPKTIIALALLAGCSSHSREDFSLDPGIPRVETPTSQIAYIRTKWKNDKHVETAFFDRQDRPLEVFRFGRTSVKTLNQYEGENNDMTIRYYHSDSSPIGYVDVDTLRRAYDKTGRLVVEAHAFGVLDKNAGKVPPDGYYRRYLEYNTKGDTIIKKVESSYDTTNTSVVVNIDRWEKDRKQRLGRHYRLQVVRQNDSIKDTAYHYSQRFAYDSTGKLALAWFDYKRPGGYVSGGAETIWYRYDERNRLMEERHYTGDVIAFFEKIGLDISASAMQQENWYRKNAFAIESNLRNNKDYFSTQYEYEAFDPEKHLPLKIPIK